MVDLKTYHRKRNFARTPEPAGSVEAFVEEADSTKGGKFVIHKHAASRLHYDLRLEQNGVLTSWAVPKGPSLVPGEKRLAVKVEDHPLEYGDFEGTIPPEEYGGGTVMLWDRGRWAPVEREGHKKKKKNEERIDFVLAGEKLQGLWTLVRTSGRDTKTANHWMLIKRHDNVSEDSEMTDLSVATGRTMEEIAANGDARKTKRKPPGRQKSVSQRSFTPDLANLKGAVKKTLRQKPLAALASAAKEAPGGDDWLHEIKFDGYRILAKLQKRAVQLISRNGHDWTRRFPEIRQWLEKFTVKDAILDGEVIALSDDGTSSFRNLQEALSARDSRGLVYQAFDLMHLNGYDLSSVPLQERKAILQQLIDNTPFPDASPLVRYTDHIQGNGPEFFRKACQLGLEGIISKKMASTYRPGRGKSWQKTKCANHEEFLICGYTRPNGSRKGFGALLLGVWHNGDLIYTGRVGTGFSHNLLLSLYERLRELTRDTCPFSQAPENERGVRWVNPELIAEVEFTEWTRDGVLRHSSFRGLREDKEPNDILLPEAAPKTSPAKSPKPSAKNPKVQRAAKAEVAGVPLSNPDRILFPDQGITKLHLAQYYADIAEWILPLISYRPLSLVRCPDGRTGECFFQKHPRGAFSDDIPRIDIQEKSGTKPYLYVTSLPHLIGLMQAGALELHIWGSKVDKLEQPDQLVFDLDPAPNVPLQEIFRVAHELKQRLEDLGLVTFPRVTGGKGLHLVVPIKPKLEWDEAKNFCRTIAQNAAADDKTRLTATMAKSKRRGKTFIDYLRNGRGATAIASYSTRARPGAPIAVPVSWEEVNESLTPNRYTVENLRRRLGALQDDPWQCFEDARRPITKKMLAKAGVKAT